MAKKTIRPLGDVLLDMEPYLFEIVKVHGLQKGELKALIETWTDIHYPEALEEYLDGTNPISYYGHKDGLKKIAKGLK